jgi:hypothetical protein
MAVQVEASLTERQQYWLKHVRACDSAGKTTVEYAQEHGIEVKTMYSARKLLVGKGVLPQPKSSCFQKVEVVSGVADTQWRVQLPNGAVVDFGGEVDGKSLTLVLRTVASLS